MVILFRPFVSPYGDMDFEWDAEKSLITFDKRDYVLAAARLAFRGKLLRRLDKSHSQRETRYQVLAELMGKIFLIVYTPRQRKCRIITLRRATKLEEAIYHDCFD